MTGDHQPAESSSFTTISGGPKYGRKNSFGRFWTLSRPTGGKKAAGGTPCRRTGRLLAHCRDAPARSILGPRPRGYRPTGGNQQLGSRKQSPIRKGESAPRRIHRGEKAQRRVLGRRTRLPRKVPGPPLEPD